MGNKKSTVKTSTTSAKTPPPKRERSAEVSAALTTLEDLAKPGTAQKAKDPGIRLQAAQAILQYDLSVGGL